MALPLNGSPQSPAALSHIVAELSVDKVQPPLEKALLCDEHDKYRNGGLIEQGYLCRGLTISELAALLESDELQTSCLELETRDPREATLHLKSMLSSRIPVMALVDINSVSMSVTGRPFSPEDPGTHVITVVGYKAVNSDEISDVVFHDGHIGPYREMSFGEFVDSAYSTPGDKGIPVERIWMFAAIPKVVAPNVYKDTLWIALANYDCYSPSIQLSSVLQFVTYLVKHVPGHMIKHLENRATGRTARFPDVLGERLKKPSSNVGENHMLEMHPIWAVQYTPKRDENESVYVDIIDAAESGNGQRLGTVCLGHNPREDQWIFAKGKGSILDDHFLTEFSSATQEDQYLIQRV